MDFATWIRIFAGLVVLAGLTCLPMGLGAHPYYFTSPFSFFAESGALIRMGAILIVSGVAVFVLSWFFG
jgi:hypothetical protein